MGSDPVVHSVQSLPLPTEPRDPFFFPFTALPARVDSEPYLNLLQALSEQRRLRPEQVHPESIISAFSYSQNVPRGEVRLTTEHGRAPWADGHELVFVNLKAGEEPAPPTRAVFVVDTSGSMSSVFGSVRAALREYVRHMRPGDSVGFVTYAGGEQTFSPRGGDEKGAMLDFINSMEQGGFVTHSRGIVIAYEYARLMYKPGAVNTVTVITDGDFRGIGLDEADLIKTARAKWEKDKIRTSAIGAVHGSMPGNMEDLAGASGGYSGVLSSVSGLRSIAKAQTIPAADDLSIRVSFDPDRIASFRLIAHEGSGACLPDARLDPLLTSVRRLYPGESVSFLLELIPADSEEGRSLVAGRVGRTRRKSEASGQTYIVKAGFNRPDGSPRELESRGRVSPSATPSRDFRLASALGGIGLYLHGSRYANIDTTTMMEELRKAAAQGNDPNEKEFAALVDRVVLRAENPRIKTAGIHPRGLRPPLLSFQSDERSNVCRK